jgi:hypothetical protein
VRSPSARSRVWSRVRNPSRNRRVTKLNCSERAHVPSPESIPQKTTTYIYIDPSASCISHSLNEFINYIYLHVFDQLVDSQSSFKNFIKIVCKKFLPYRILLRRTGSSAPGLKKSIEFEVDHVLDIVVAEFAELIRCSKTSISCITRRLIRIYS